MDKSSSKRRLICNSQKTQTNLIWQLLTNERCVPSMFWAIIRYMLSETQAGLFVSLFVLHFRIDPVNAMCSYYLPGVTQPYI